MVIELPAEFEASLKGQALLRGLTVDDYVREVIKRDLRLAEKAIRSDRPFVTGRGILAAFGPAPSAEEIDANREEMFHGFGEEF
jgi:hypothetical protein